MKILIQIDESELDVLYRESHKLGYLRTDPRKPWTLPERKLAARYVIATWIGNKIKELERNGH